LLVLSLAGIVIIVVSFIYTLRVIVIQKRFYISIIDFINNMTHEFKTPISTIALASEAIAKPEVVKSKPKVLQYNALISDENNRMKQQVDKILQMAVLEEGKIELHIAEIDMHSVIQQTIKNISFHVKARNGKITTRLSAANAKISGDAVHLANIVNTLFDNAIKYSSTLPVITIETENIDSRFVLRIIDNGIGIGRDDLLRVFDKYFRVSTGNTHNVKGFGLGLSYVKLMVEAHHGTVELQSRLHHGTTVTIHLPV
jgi:two-component system phosphate regulon sensor histidine kinase PhoR